ncbi:MAG: NifB/NifX family molybdenum-iron cluster-binding protein [Paenibacillus sp.]|jgi:nitrogen fixation protein NifX|uniref:NifB/NifX family molybdenum-iron cluster-binding protein n=1 Tax=Paenibacillus sp. TaxID=58172 RepID=UPI0029073C47|nr:NifB/NifX family molybdenum-iron cluster-binding protein [Paenibacillus sp.]MDU4698154.1 NifB/NifX family molybdenum-iron cluster-binding protein [Paenibacillus sp.]
MRVAFATDDGQHVNAHFGHAPMFTVYEIRQGSAVSSEKRCVPAHIAGDELGKIDLRITLIEDCTLVFLTQIGASAAAKVTRRKMMPVKVQSGVRIEDQVGKLLELLRGNPPMWLSKVLRAEEDAVQENGSPQEEGERWKKP